MPQVIALWQNYDESPELKELAKTTTDMVKEWRTILIEFQAKINKRYGATLSAKGSGTWVKDASKKVLWLKEKNYVLDLRRKLQMASDTITLLCLAAMG